MFSFCAVVAPPGWSRRRDRRERERGAVRPLEEAIPMFRATYRAQTNQG